MTLADDVDLWDGSLDEVARLSVKGGYTDAIVLMYGGWGGAIFVGASSWGRRTKEPLWCKPIPVFCECLKKFKFCGWKIGRDGMDSIVNLEGFWAIEITSWTFSMFSKTESPYFLLSSKMFKVRF